MSGSQSAKQRRFLGPVFAGLAVVTCPCHLPLWAPLLAGTAAGAFLSQQFAVAVTVLSLLFLGFVAAAMHILGSGRSTGR